MKVQPGREWLISAAIFFLFLGVFYGCKAPDAPRENFNIVLITIDTLRADHLSCYGYARETSPHIDAVAKQGFVFKNVVAPSSWTAPSMVSLFTSTYPVNHGVIHGLEFQKARGLIQEIFSEKLITLPAVLQDRGYTTFGVSSNHTLTAELGFARGFDHFKYVNWQAAADINKIVYSWEDAIKKSNRYFLWVHYIDPHSPYFPQSPWISNYTTENQDAMQLVSRLSAPVLMYNMKQNPALLSMVTALYDSEINYVDSCVGALIERLAIDNNTLLVITSDHGEQFMEHARIGHAISLHKEELHVPLIIKFPEASTMPSGDQQASLLDVMPTILDVLHIDQPEQTRGRSLLDNEGTRARLGRLLPGGQAPVHHFAELESSAIVKAIIAPPWKYIYNYNTTSGQLYDTVSDPFERTNLMDVHAGQGELLKEQLFSYVSQAKVFPTRSLVVRVSPGEREKLETLGYLSSAEKQDDDKDGVVDEDDNCADRPNGPARGMCTRGHKGEFCVSHDQCGVDGFCSMLQEDGDRDGYGDACDGCEGAGAYDMDGDGVCEQAPSTNVNLWLEAEHAKTIVPPFKIADDEEASGGRFIYVPNASGNEYTPGGSIAATYEVTISQPGVYFLWGRVQARNTNDDSFFVKVDDDADNLWMVAIGEQWHWDTVNDRDIADPVRFALNEGVHTIRIKLREDGTKLDKMLLTNDPAFVPSGEGGVAEHHVHP